MFWKEWEEKIYSIKKLLYQAYLLSVLDYCDAVWAPTNANQTKHLKRLHSKYTSSCTDSSISKYFLSEFHTTVQVYKILCRIVPAYLYNIFEYAINVTGHVSRNVHRLFVPQVNTNYGKCSLYYRGTTMWNALPAAACILLLTQFRNNYLRTF